MTGSAGYITVTIGPPDPAQLSAHPLYIRFACAHTDARRRENFVFLKTILDQVQTLHVVAKGENRATFGADEILAKECVQKRQTCSVGGRPTGVKARSPLAWVASVEKTKRMKPTDNYAMFN